MAMSEYKKRKLKIGLIVGTISGAVLFSALYLFAAPSLAYLVFVPIGAAMGGAQVYMTPD